MIADLITKATETATREVATSSTDAAWVTTSIRWRVRRLTSADLGHLSAVTGEAVEAEAPSSDEDARRALRIMRQRVCAAVVSASGDEGKTWEPVQVVDGGTMDPGCVPVDRLPLLWLRDIAAAAVAFAGEGGEVLATFLGGGVDHRG